MNRKRKHNPVPETRRDPAPGSFAGRHPTLTRLALAVLAPLLVLAATEGLLRAFSVGYPTNLFLKVSSAGAYGANRQFGWRFFPRKIARKPVPQSFAVDKSERTCRIFTLGASAALGVPNSAFSFTRSLEVMLRSRYPGVDFEVINTALTAINSHVVLPIARECAHYEPDMYLVYLGNNEVIGPYGIGASRTGAAANLNTVRTGIALRATRLGQLMQGLVEKRQAGDPDHEHWRGMERYSRNMVASDDPALDLVHDNFRRNLHDIVLAGTGAGAQVVLSTVATNLRDSAPFASLADTTLPPGRRLRVEHLIATAQALLAKQGFAAARDSLTIARDLDPGYADTHYLMGHALFGLGQAAQAREAFAAALELDALRFRTDRRLNDIIRQTAKQLASEGVYLADTEQIVRGSEPSGSGIPGHEMFYEHVHLTFQGNYLVARALLPTVEQALPTWVQQYAATPKPLPTIDDCARGLLFTAANEYLNLAQMRTTMTPYPFTAQIDHTARLAAIDGQLEQLKARATPDVQRATVEAYQQAFRRRPGDLLLGINFAKILALTGNNGASNRVVEQVMKTQPPAADLEEMDMTQMMGGG